MVEKVLQSIIDGEDPTLHDLVEALAENQQPLSSDLREIPEQK